jgi:hypothetical protein|tara:strand:- start:787 stop:891 length:105 start_codon:yes stop_codon:yes gene_type:complete
MSPRLSDGAMASMPGDLNGIEANVRAELKGVSWS